MGNCLVTKLKGVVDNGNLPILGAFKVRFEASDSTDRVLQCTGVTKAQIVNSEDANLHFTSLDGTGNYGTEATVENGGILSSGGFNFIKINAGGACDVIIYGKYDLTTLVENHWFINVEDFSYIGANNQEGIVVGIIRRNNEIPEGTGMDVGNIFNGLKVRDFYLQGEDSYYYLTCLKYIEHPELIKAITFINLRTSVEDLNKIKSCNNLEVLKVQNSLAPSFLLSDFGSLIHLNLIQFGGLSGVTSIGSIESFVTAQRGAGRITCDGITYKNPEKVTFNGTSYTGTAQDITLSWTASTITFDGVTINA